MHSSRMRTARSSSRRGGGSPPSTPREQTPPPRTRHPPTILGQAHPQVDQEPPQEQTPPGPGTPPDQAPPSVNRITDTCKNITFPQLRFRAVITSFTMNYSVSMQRIWELFVQKYNLKIFFKYFLGDTN